MLNMKLTVYMLYILVAVIMLKGFPNNEAFIFESIPVKVAAAKSVEFA